MKRLCICEICNCGRHRCPHAPTGLYAKANDVCVLTEYSEKYPTYEAYKAPTSLKPNQAYRKEQGKMDGTTTFKSDYIPYEVSRRPVKQQAEYKPNSGAIDLGTTYKQDFNPYEVQPFIPVRPKERMHSKGGKLDTIPTYKEDFRSWDVRRRELPRTEFIYQPPTVKFGNATTFQDDFVPRGLVPRESFKPPNVAKQSNEPFEGLTSNRISFVAHPLEARFVKPKEEYKPSSQPFQDHTTHRTDFQGLPGPLPKSCKPDFAKVASDAPFYENTEFRDSFQQWPVSLPQVRQPAEYVGPGVPMDLSTTFQNDFTKHAVQPFVSVRPLPRPVQSSARFQGNTTMRDDFKAWSAQRQEMIRPEEKRKSSGQFDFLTTFKAHYTQHDVHPPASCKPTHVPMKSEVPFEDGTMYRNEFTPKKITVCPASFASPPGYVFDNCDERGHKFFREVSSQEGNKMEVASAVHIPKEVAVLS